MKKGDIILILILLVVGVIGCVALLLLNRDGAYVAVSIDGENQGVYSLAKDRELVIKTEDGGENVFVIKDGVVDMVSSNCPNQDCVMHNPISDNNESIVCLPHRLAIVIYNEKTVGETDATVY